MKNLRQMKKWTLMSVLLCGISLAAYAFAPQVWILSWSVTNVTSRSAHLVVEHEGATHFQLEIYDSDDRYVGGISKDINSFYPGDVIYSVMDLENLRPNTTYTLRITVTGFPGETQEPNKDVEEISFTTDSEVQP
ncbi:MAG: hypothetical protein IKT28_02300 [Rikenellaceae bacterium]|nr:hypothetical protein [Rikenellaceae bacterium]